VTRASEYRRSAISLQPPRFRGTRDLKFSPIEQEAIRYAEAALGYRRQQEMSPTPQTAGAGWFVRALLALLFLSVLFAAISRLITTGSSPRAEAPAPSRPLSVGPLRGDFRSAPRPSPQPMPQPTVPLHLAASAPPPPSVVYTNVGDRIVAQTSAGVTSAAAIYAESPIAVAPERQSQTPPQTQKMNVTQLVPPAPTGDASPTHPIITSGPWESFGPLQPVPRSPTWHQFTSPHSVPSDGRWHTFGPLQSDAPSAESAQSSLPPGSLTGFTRHPVKRHSLFRRVLGGVGQVIEGVAVGVAAPLQAVTQGLPLQAFPYPAPPLSRKEEN
jgi:hypothetical protein